MQVHCFRYSFLFADEVGTPSESASTCDKPLLSGGCHVTFGKQGNVTSTMALLTAKHVSNRGCSAAFRRHRVPYACTNPLSRKIIRQNVSESFRIPYCKILHYSNKGLQPNGYNRYNSPIEIKEDSQSCPFCCVIRKLLRYQPL